MILYDYFRSSASYRVRIALNLKGLKPERRHVHLLKGEQREAAFKSINPQGFVPYLVDGDFALTQSLAIIEYLDEKYPDPPVMPKEIEARAQVRAIAQLIACDIHPLNNSRVLTALSDWLKVSDTTKAEWYCRWIHEGFAALEEILNRRTVQSPFCVGASPTLADICLVPQVTNAYRFKCALDKFPTLMGIHQNALQLAAFSDAQPSKQPDAE